MTTVALPKKNTREKLLPSFTEVAFAPAPVLRVDEKDIEALYADSNLSWFNEIPKHSPTEHLLEIRLKKLCKDWKINYQLDGPVKTPYSRHKTETTSIIEYFSYCLTYKSIKGATRIQERGFYLQIKNNLERFIVHLQNKNILEEDRKTHLNEIIGAMLLCATGVLNKLYEFNAHFETTYTLGGLLADCRLLMVKECASEAARQYSKYDDGSRLGDDVSMAYYEIHFQQRFFKYAGTEEFNLALPNIEKLTQNFEDRFDSNLNQFYRQNENGTKIFFGSTNPVVNNSEEAVHFFYETFRKKYTLQGIAKCLLTMAEKQIADLGITDAEFDLNDVTQRDDGSENEAEKFSRVIKHPFFAQKGDDSQENWQLFFIETPESSGIYTLTDCASLVRYLAPKLSNINVEEVVKIAVMTSDNYLEMSKDLAKHILGNSEEDKAYLTEYLAKMMMLFPESSVRQIKINEVLNQSPVVSTKKYRVELKRAIDAKNFAKFELLMEAGFILRQVDYKDLMNRDASLRAVERAARAYYQDKLKRMTEGNCLDFYEQFFLKNIRTKNLFDCYVENSEVYFLKIKELMRDSEMRFENIRAFLNKRETKDISLSAHLREAVENNPMQLFKIEFLLSLGVVPSCEDFFAIKIHLQSQSQESSQAVKVRKKIQQNYLDGILNEIWQDENKHVEKFLELFPKNSSLTHAFVEPYLATMRELFPKKEDFEKQLQFALETRWGDKSSLQEALNKAIMEESRPIHNNSKVDLLVAAGVALNDVNYQDLRKKYPLNQEKNDSGSSSSIAENLFNKAAKVYSHEKLKETLTQCTDGTITDKNAKLKMIKACVEVITPQDPISRALFQYVKYRTGGLWGWLFGSISSERYTNMLDILNIAEEQEFEAQRDKEWDIKKALSSGVMTFKSGCLGMSKLRGCVLKEIRNGISKKL